MKELLSGPYEKCSSSLLADDSAAFLSLILTLIGLKVGKGYTVILTVIPVWVKSGTKIIALEVMFIYCILQLVKSFEQLWSFLSHTLLYVQLKDDSYLKDCCHRAVAQLAALGYITMEAGRRPDDSTYSITMLGRATYRGE